MSQFGINFEVIIDGEGYSEEDLELALLKTSTQITGKVWDLFTTGLQRNLKGDLGQDYNLTFSQDIKNLLV